MSQVSKAAVNRIASLDAAGRRRFGFRLRPTGGVAIRRRDIPAAWPATHVSKLLLILDLDEPLVHAAEQPLTRDADFRVGSYHVYRRPHLDYFLKAVAGWYDMAVWSSASGTYVREVVAHLFAEAAGLRFVWSCDRCTRRYDPELHETYYAKNLSKLRKLGFALEHILIVDDSPEKLARHYGNHIRVRPFVGDEADTELRDLLPFLESLRSAENVRRIEKRGWRGHFGDQPRAGGHAET